MKHALWHDAKQDAKLKSFRDPETVITNKEVPVSIFISVW
uniref:Uncharacterized protein n=1 Tax=Rheinheimera sp. BAL341 TaxID=1708203 RepID=A0A486XVW8_9GAMM